jgi:predicted HicB family RNase H-like nuclease
MGTFKHRNYEGSCDADADTRVCHGRILHIADLITYEANDPNALHAEFVAAVDDYIAMCDSLGKTPEKPYKGVFQVRVSPELHRAAAIRAAQEGITLNALVDQSLSASVYGPAIELLAQQVVHAGTVGSAPITVAATAGGNPATVSQHVH